MKGIFISFEGSDGSGKTTQLRLFKDYLDSNNYDSVFTREPGGTEISEEIRKIILDPNHTEMDDTTEAFLYAASRAQHVAQLIKPSMDAGKIVVSDRFMDSSIAYQGYGRGLGEAVRTINEIAVAGTQPDLTFFLNISPEKGMARAKKREDLDRLELEKMEFHQAVYKGYLELSNIYKDRFVMINADQSPEAVHQEIISHFEEFIANRAK